MAGDSFWVLEGTTYLRLHNTDTGETEYFTVAAGSSAVPTIKSVEEILKRETAADPLLRPVNTTTTGARYGFLVQRSPRDLIFKVTEPPAVGKKVGRGSAEPFLFFRSSPRRVRGDQRPAGVRPHRRNLRKPRGF